MASNTTTLPTTTVITTSASASSARSPLSSPAQAKVPTPTKTEGAFLRPSSPRKRRRSPEAGQSPSKSLEGQVRDKLAIDPPSTTIALTGAAEMAEQKRRKLEHHQQHIQEGTGKLQSPNPTVQALGALRGTSTRGMSRVTEAPQASANMSYAQSDAPGSEQTSPVSNASFNTATSATAGVPRVASPVQMDEGDAPGDEDGHDGDASGNAQPSSPKAFSYPDPRLSAVQTHGNARRDMSLPGSGRGDGTKSPSSNKKHKCQYCETEFTRHHNLKSHLLTHSQEKPYICHQCEMRFRRLHDLKRHTKLHTGERPHVCPICNRKFARGDALARHTKGQGGCAGHRSSVGSFTNEAAEGEIVMDGLMYAGEASQEPGEMDEGEGGARQLRHAQYQGSMQVPQGRVPSTYPPVAARSSGGPYLQAPTGHASGNVSPAAQHNPYGQPGSGSSYPAPSAFAPGSITESPGPISPSTGPHPAPPPPPPPPPLSSHDPRRSSINPQLHQYARQGPHNHPTSAANVAGPAPTATMGLPPPQSVALNSTSGTGQYALPAPLPSMNAGAPHSHANTASGSYHSAPGSASTHNSLSSHGQGSSGERNSLGIDEKERLYAVIHQLRSQMESLQHTVQQLTQEVQDLKRGRDEPAATA